MCVPIAITSGLFAGQGLEFSSFVNTFVTSAGLQNNPGRVVVLNLSSLGPLALKDDVLNEYVLALKERGQR